MQLLFSLEIVGADDEALLREHVAGACFGSKLPRVNRPYNICGSCSIDDTYRNGVVLRIVNV